MLVSVNTAYNSCEEFLSARCIRCKSLFVRRQPYQKLCSEKCVKARKVEQERERRASLRQKRWIEA